ncbi:MAG: hypothetical protein JW934_11530 [Anaerolineae bacterium]|nr:hypothetical protein [Anaerolineae bacterium]
MSTNRARLSAILDGTSPDAIPWMPRLQTWYDAHQRQGTLPERFQGHTLREIERMLGTGDCAVVEYLVQHTEIVPAYDQ